MADEKDDLILMVFVSLRSAFIRRIVFRIGV